MIKIVKTILRIKCKHYLVKIKLYKISWAILQNKNSEFEKDRIKKFDKRINYEKLYINQCGQI